LKKVLKIQFSDIVLNENIHYYHNPFGGVSNDELLYTIQPKYDIETWVTTLKEDTPKIIQFVGKKGRGKTTHLSVLHQYFPDMDIYYLDRIHKKIKSTKTNIVFIDSIHKIPIHKRISLWKKKNISYIISTHINKALEFKIAGRSYETYYFKGIQLEELKQIIIHRVAIASNITPQEVSIQEKYINELILAFKDDFRGILNFLYDAFNQRNYGNI